ncbi:MAG: heavy metal translocating P-type ATPase metal-binding domain-containing protein, partial [Verrucomicrobia bacterium]|nr:heavy metal translocating P-type ATPase metal-binding domain-containing protein [Verrucomicrobiota bacterium]
MASCTHCGTEFSPSQEEENFCCRGCEFVHDLIQGQGLERFYDLQDGTVGQPVRDRPFQPTEFTWLEELCTPAEAKAADLHGTASLLLRVRGISCVGCVWLIEKIFLRQPGGLRADVFPSTGKLHLTWQPGEASIPAFAATLLRFGYKLEPWQENSSPFNERDTLVSRLGLCGAFALNSMVFTLPRYLGMGDDFALAAIFSLITLLSATFSLLVGGSYFIKRAWSALRHRVLHIDLPIALGILLAYTGSLAGWILHAEHLLYFDFVAIFTFLMLAGRYLQIGAAEKVRAQMLCQAPIPTTVTLPTGASIPLDALEKGTEFLVPSGAVVPVTGLLTTHGAEFSLAWITGEPEPVSLPPGRRVAAGAVNLNRHPVTLRCEEPWSDSLVAALAQHSDRPTRNLPLERILRAYLLVVLLLGLVGGLTWAITSGDPVRGIQIAIAVFVVSCPCALGVALPLADQLATARLQRRGVFIQNPSLWSRLRHIRRILLDKTGTLTLEHPRLDNREALIQLNSEARQALATLAASSLHPLSRSLLESLPTTTHSRFPISDLPGRGLYFDHNHSRWSLGRPGWDTTTDAPPDETNSLACDFRRDGKLLARFTFSEATRPEAREALHTLQHRHHLTPVIISGDAPSRVQLLAATLGLDPANAHGGLSPTEKESLVRQLDHLDTLYLGDGANDSLAFDAAYASGTPVADRSVLDQKTDFFFTSRGLGFLPHLFDTARLRTLRVRQVFAFAILYNLAAIALCLTGHMTPLLAAILMPLSSLACLFLA